MNVAGILPPPLLDAAEAIGLVTATQDVNASWFENPLKQIESILSNGTQRAALFDLLDQVLPAEPVPGVPGGTKWHPLLGTQTQGNVYLTVDESSVPILIGVGARYAGSIAAVRMDMPILALSGTSLSAVAGTAGGPLQLSVDVTLGWSMPTQPIALAGVSLQLLFAPAAASPVASFVIQLRGLDMDGKGAHDVTIDPASLGTEAATLIIGLVRAKLAEIAGGATGEALIVATHLPPLLGLDGTLPPFPFATLGSDPRALSKWLASLTAGDPAPLAQWLTHLAALLGVAAPTVTLSKDGGASISSIAVLAPNPASSISLGLVQGTAADLVTPTLGLQLGATLAPSATGPAALDAAVTLFAVPLAGTASAVVLPGAYLRVRAPAGSAPWIAPAAGQFSIDGMHAGVAWDGKQMTPLLELDNVVIPAAGTYPKIDLTNANTVISSAASALVGTVLSGLGSSGAGAHLAALAGLTEPSSDASAPLVDFAQLATQPTRAMATLHRNALLSSTHPWSIYLTELSALLSIGGSVSGDGKPDTPWSIPLTGTGPLSVALVAWNAQTSGNSADAQQLRIGLRAQATADAVTANWTSTLFAADLPASGANQVTMFGLHEAAVTLTPPAFSAGLAQVTVTDLRANFSLAAGAAAQINASINGLAVTSPSGSLNVPTLSFPWPAGFDPQNPGATLGISSAQLASLLSTLATDAFERGLGEAGVALAALLGCGAGLPGLPVDVPDVGNVAGAALFADPAQAWRSWLAKVATTLSADGGDFASRTVAWLQSLLANSLPAAPGVGPDRSGLSGSGTHDDPWVLPLGSATSAAQGLLWLEPAGPPSSAAAAAAAVNAANDFASLMSALPAARRYLGTWPDGVDVTALATGLQAIGAHLATTDGVVPVSSQLPTGGSWGTGTALGSAHAQQPNDASAISQIIAQVDSWVAPGNPRCILLLGPAFSDHTTWNALLAQAEAAHAGTTSVAATFNLRIAGVAPTSIDLRPVTAIADYYSADLQDDGSNDLAGLAAQIGLVVARLNALRPGAPVMLVAHSTAGVAACTYAAANSAALKGLITLGTPHQGAPLTPLLDVGAADALRIVSDWLPAGFPAGPLDDAMNHLWRALDGYLPPPSAGALPIRWTYPVADFDGSGSTNTGGVPALALGGQLAGGSGVDFLASLKAALVARIQGFSAAAPTHLAFGVQTQLPLGAQGGGGSQAVSAEASLRIDAGRLALQSGGPSPAGPAQALMATVSLSRQGGWLAGDARSYAGSAAPMDVRVRSARLGLSVALSGPSPQATPFAALYDAACHGPTTAVVGWTDALFAPALGSLFASISADVSAATPLGHLLGLLQALGIATTPTAANAGVGIAADAVNALTVDALGFLAPKLGQALAQGLVPGFQPATGGYACAMAGLPLEAFATLSPATFGLRTTVGSNGLTIGGKTSVSGSVALPLGTMQSNISVALGAGPASLAYANGGLSLQVPTQQVSLPLVPAPTTSQVKDAFAALLPPLLISGIASPLIESLLPTGAQVSGLYSFLQGPRQWLVQAGALGDGTVFDPAKLTSLVNLLGPLPAGLTLKASGKDPTTLTLATGTPLGGVLAIDAGVTLDRTGHVLPSVTLTFDTPTSGTWTSVAATLGLSTSGLSLSLTPAGMSPIGLLPVFDGAAALAGAAKKLLPQALDALMQVVAPGPKPPLVTLALDVAGALDLYDNVGGFAAHASQLAAMTTGTWFSALPNTARSAFITAASAFFNDASSPLHGALPGSISSTGNALAWNYPLPGGVGAGTVSVTAGWDVSGPTLAVGLASVSLSNSPLMCSLAGGFAAGAASVSGGVGLSLQSSLGIGVTPQLSFAAGSGAPALTLLPLGAGTASTLALQLAPTLTFTAAAGAPAQLVEDWVMPLVADLLIGATGTSFATPLYNGGPSVETLLSNAKLINIGGGPAPGKYTLKTPLPSVDAILASLLQSLPAVPIKLVADPPLTLLLGNSGGSLGAALQGSIAISTGSPSLNLVFGQPGDAPTQPGVQLALFAGGSTPTFAPSLHVRGIGVGCAGSGGGPLLNESWGRIGNIEGFIAFDLDLTKPKISGLGGGLSIGQLGLPLGLLDSVTGGNPVASSLLSSNGGAGGGDSAPVNPAVDVEVSYLANTLSVRFAGTDQPIVIPVHASFGPLYIDQIDLALNGSNAVSIGIDGSLSISGLTVGVDELAVLIPVPSVLKPGDWSIDLQGLAVGFSSGPVEISGGLRKDPGPPIQYEGMLSASIADIGLTVVGAYSRPSDAQGGYTSMFMFATVLAPLGGPPFAFITGLAGGLGENRALMVPDNLDQLDSFVLIAAMDDDSLANDPMGALMKMGQSIPPRRGAFWLAGGLRLTSFALVNSTVLVTIAIDRGLDIEVLGISRMALPAESVALVSVELALRAKFNSAEQMLSIQAQLTDNSYLFSRDCQLTGGFALVVWYGQGQFVMSLGGYNPVFAKPPQFPDVPRLGFHWSIGDLVVIKGGAYFALTNSCVMAGGSLSATASIGPVSAWFDAYLDFLVAWDPFQYEFDIGVEIGASLDITICFFGCVTIGITISLGAQLAIAGPPFHGTASIDAYVTTITVSFGDPPQPPPYITDWHVFAGKYLTAGDPNDSAVSVQVTGGLLTPDPPGAQPQPGTQGQPWQLGVEFTLSTTTRMPASSCPGDWNGAPIQVPGQINTIDLAPMDRLAVTSSHSITLQQWTNGGWAAAQVDDATDHFTITATRGFFPEATWHWNDPAHLPAAARTIAAISGFGMDAHVVLNHESALIPISTLVNDQPQYALPLPFATTADVVPTFKTYGAEAQALALAVANASSQKMLAAGAAILAGSDTFATNRTALGLSATGLLPLASQSLRRQRSAPPLLTPLTTGLTMKPVGLPAPLRAETLAQVGSILLAQPRLRTVLQAVAVPVTDAPAAQRTTVSIVPAAVLRAAPRMTPPGARTPMAVAGAKLMVVPAAAAPRPTRAARDARALRNADLGAVIGVAHEQALTQAATDLLGTGVILGAGALHLWDVPDDTGAFAFGGTDAVRMVCTNRAGHTLRDVEFVAGAYAPSALPADTCMVAIQCLGGLPAGAAAPVAGAGAITGNFAPSGQTAAVGWQRASTLMQIGPTCFLARGATLRVARPHASKRAGQRASYGMPSAAQVMDGQSAVETRLPSHIGVLMILLDVSDAGAAQNGDLAIAATGATLAVAPQRVVVGARRLLLYDVVARDASADALTVSVASMAGFALGGVIGLMGNAAEWAHRLSGGVPDHFVPDGALSAGGSLTVTYKATAP